MQWNRIMGPKANSTSNYNKKIISLAYKLDDEFISNLESELKKAAKSAGYDLVVLDSKNSVYVQLAQVKSAQSSGEKAIIINLVDPDTAPMLLEAAGDMKVVFASFVPTDMRLLNENVIFAGSDQRIAGKMQGEWLANHFKERGINEIKYILLKGIPGLLITEERTNSVLQALADNGIKAIEATPPVVANLDRKEATAKLIPILSSGVEFDAIISNNDAMALGAIQALEHLNMNPKKTTIVGIDATEPAIEAIIEGTLAMTVFQDIELRATAIIKAMTNMLDGKPFSAGIEKLVSKDNPYVILTPYEPVTRYQIPKNLYL